MKASRQAERFAPHFRFGIGSDDQDSTFQGQNAFDYGRDLDYMPDIFDYEMYGPRFMNRTTGPAPVPPWQQPPSGPPTGGPIPGSPPYDPSNPPPNPPPTGPPETQEYTLPSSYVPGGSMRGQPPPPITSAADYYGPAYQQWARDNMGTPAAGGPSGGFPTGPGGARWGAHMVAPGTGPVGDEPGYDASGQGLDMSDPAIAAWAREMGSGRYHPTNDPNRFGVAGGDEGVQLDPSDRRLLGGRSAGTAPGVGTPGFAPAPTGGPSPGSPRFVPRGSMGSYTAASASSGPPRSTPPPPRGAPMPPRSAPPPPAGPPPPPQPRRSYGLRSFMSSSATTGSGRGRAPGSPPGHTPGYIPPDAPWGSEADPGTGIPGWDTPGQMPPGIPTDTNPRMPPAPAPRPGPPGPVEPRPPTEDDRSFPLPPPRSPEPAPPRGFPGPPPGYENINRWGQGGASGNRQLASGSIWDQAIGTLADPNIDEATRNAITQEGMNAARSAFSGARGALARRTSATGNAAGNAAAIAQLGRSEAGVLGQQGRMNQIAFEQEAQRRREGALSRIAGLYAGETGYQAGLLGQRGGLATTVRGGRQRSRTSTEAPAFQIDI